MAAALRMQGFVSNRDSEKNEDKADPLEIVLYAVFVATSARASVGELADILQVNILSGRPHSPPLQGLPIGRFTLALPSFGRRCATTLLWEAEAPAFRSARVTRPRSL